MRNIFLKFSKVLFNFIMAIAVLSVNVTCTKRFYQKELGNQLDGLRKYKDE